MKKNHQYCDNAITNLNIKLNELKNEIEFQKKLLSMKEAKEKKKQIMFCKGNHPQMIQ